MSGLDLELVVSPDDCFSAFFLSSTAAVMVAQWEQRAEERRQGGNDGGGGGSRGWQLAEEGSENLDRGWDSCSNCVE